MKKKGANKLVLFDIDGTLIRPLVGGKALQRFSYAIKKAYGVDVQVDELSWGQRYNGKGDWWIISDLVRDHGLSQSSIKWGLDRVGRAFCEYLDRMAQGGKVYEAIEDAQALVDVVVGAPHLTASVLTGNLGASAQWKLTHAGYKVFYTFGVFGHEAQDRKKLAKLVLPKAKKHLGYEVHPNDVVVIGDTVHDIRCARSIGARVIAVTSGWHVDPKGLEKEWPDLLVDSLMDERVLDLLGLMG